MPELGTYFLMPYIIFGKCTGLLFLPGTSMRPVIVRDHGEKGDFVPCTGFPTLTISAPFSPLFPSFPLFLPSNLFTGKKKDGVLGTHFPRSQSQSAFRYVPGYVPGSKKPGTQGAATPITVRDLHVPGYVPGSEERHGSGAYEIKSICEENGGREAEHLLIQNCASKYNMDQYAVKKNLKWMLQNNLIFLDKDKYGVV